MLSDTEYKLSSPCDYSHVVDLIADVAAYIHGKNWWNWSVVIC